MNNKGLFTVATSVAIFIIFVMHYQEFQPKLMEYLERSKKAGSKIIEAAQVMVASSQLKNDRDQSGNRTELLLNIDPVAVNTKWPGLMLNGNYILKDFVDPTDRRALGMGKKPKKIEEMSAEDAEARYYQLVSVTHLHCAHLKRMGNAGDGGWEVCALGPYKPQKDCLVYSFGINNDFSFDDAIGKTFGCRVLSFDPSMKQDSHNRSSHVAFFKTGIGGADRVNPKGWKLRTFQSLLRANGHENRTIDYLKMDVEGAEWESFPSILKTNSLRNVRQFALEIHLDPKWSKSDLMKHYELLLGLEKQGFRRYHSHTNPFGMYNSTKSKKRLSCCQELYYININFLKDAL